MHLIRYAPFRGSALSVWPSVLMVFPFDFGGVFNVNRSVDLLRATVHHGPICGSFVVPLLVMASIYRRSGRKTWTAKIRVWNADAGEWVWKAQSTGTRDKTRAEAIAAEMEEVSAAAKAGLMSRQRAIDAVNTILRLAGAPTIKPVPTLAGICGRVSDYALPAGI